MVGYPISHDELIALIDEHDQAQRRRKSWKERSSEALDKLLADPSKDVPSLWSEIKPVYAHLQAGKCGFCERLIGEDDVISNEQDIEHFRPKKAVNPWPPEASVGTDPLPADIPKSKKGGAGYLRLAFHESNYLVSCKTCNARFKANYFPIRSEGHQFEAEDPAPLLSQEKPYLIHPLDENDDDPETIVGFDGFLAVPVNQSTRTVAWKRAYVTIHFFGLNDPSRQDQLLLARARRLMFLGDRLREYEAAPEAGKAAAWSAVQREYSLKIDHAGCVRAAIRLYSAGKRDEVMRAVEAAKIFYLSKTGMPTDAPPPPGP
ncbi:MAG: hypothetical protein JNK37_00430 [Verrucomicrobiales bacterium]|nr:hypothetical protein [Verrucomicrobiales bacterium]